MSSEKYLSRAQRVNKTHKYNTTTHAFTIYITQHRSRRHPNLDPLPSLLDSLGGMAFAVEAVLELEAEGAVLTGVLNPRSSDHSDGAGGVLAPDHQEHGTARTVERVVCEVTLQKGGPRRRVR